MDLTIKKFNVAMELKNKGMELEIRDNNGTHLGDLYIKKVGVEWCRGQTREGGGVLVNWDDLIDWFESD